MLRRTLLVIAAGALLGACTATEPPAGADDGASAAPAAAPAPRPVPPVDPPTPDSDGLARYRCSDDSEVVVRFGHYDATVRRSDNTTFTLPRARSLSGNGVDVYVGMGLVIERAGERLRVTRDANLLTCGPAGPG